MNEDFVSFDLAKKLKEKGYPQKPDNMNCMPYYEYDEVGNHAALCNEIVWHMSTEPRDTIFAAPAIHKVLKWLREEKKIHICIIMYEYTWGYTVYDLDTFFSEEFSSYYNTYEEATLAGIEYVIDNLI